MTDNEKAAIAAGLWKPCAWCLKGGEHPEFNCSGEAPNMRDPANLWRALENVGPRTHWRMEWHKDVEQMVIFCSRFPVALEPFTFFVALYNAEHPLRNG